MKIFNKYKIENITSKELYISISKKRNARQLHLTDLSDLVLYQDIYADPDCEVVSVISSNLDKISCLVFYIKDIHTVEEIDSLFDDRILSKRVIKLNFNFDKEESLEFFEILVDVSDLKDLKEINPNVSVSVAVLKLV